MPEGITRAAKIECVHLINALFAIKQLARPGLNDLIESVHQLTLPNVFWDILEQLERNDTILLKHYQESAIRETAKAYHWCLLQRILQRRKCPRFFI